MSGSAVEQIDYKELKKELKSIEGFEIYKIVDNDPELKESNFPPSFANSLLVFDIKTAVAQLAWYFEKYGKSFTFTNVLDKKFQSMLKALIKNPEEFKAFLKTIGVDFKDIVKMLAVAVPSVFTPNLIKFIKETYLNIKPAKLAKAKAKAKKTAKKKTD